MIDETGFTKWLSTTTAYSEAVIRDTVSRIKRADRILQWEDEDIYVFYLEKTQEFKALSVSVRSQLRKSVSLYHLYKKEGK